MELENKKSGGFMKKSILNFLPKYVVVPEFLGLIENDSILFLKANKKYEIAEHVTKVAEECVKIGEQYSLDKSVCEASGYLHDISVIIKPEDMIKFSKNFDLEIYEAEEKYPFLLHQRLSAILAKELFSVTDERILSAINCHTTLKTKVNNYDMALFLADKISWDQIDTPPYHDAVTKELVSSLKKACICFMDFIVENKMLLYPHKWFEEAREELVREVQKDVDWSVYD